MFFIPPPSYQNLLLLLLLLLQLLPFYCLKLKRFVQIFQSSSYCCCLWKNWLNLSSRERTLTTCVYKSLYSIFLAYYYMLSFPSHRRDQVTTWQSDSDLTLVTSAIFHRSFFLVPHQKEDEDEGQASKRKERIFKRGKLVGERMLLKLLYSSVSS